MKKTAQLNIIPYAKNAKVHPDTQLKLIAASLRAYGWRQPIVVSKENEIIVGHGRWFAYEKYPDGIAEPWIVKADDLTPEQVRGYRLMDNKTNESQWDMGLVIEELKELTMAGFDIDLTGFDKDLLIEGNEQDDVIPDNAPTRAKLGDVWTLGAHRVMCGDSTKPEDVAGLMGGKKADMVFTDPPYNVTYVGKTKDALTIENDSMTDSEFNEFITKVVKNIFIFCNGVIYICMSSSEWGIVQEKFKVLGGHWSRVIIWVKDRMVLSRADYHTQFEPIAVINEDVNEEGEPILYGWKTGVRHFFKGGRKQTDIWRIERPLASREHPTMKPVALCTRAIINNTMDAGLILDLFLGSGSTLIAAEKTGRICYGMEIDPHYCDVIIQRYEDYTGKKAEKVG